MMHFQNILADIVTKTQKRTQQDRPPADATVRSISGAVKRQPCSVESAGPLIRLRDT
jgi:hypothetical protein